MASLGQSIFNLISPKAAEAEVRHTSPVLQGLETSIQQGSVQDIDPALLSTLQAIIGKAKAIPEVANVHLRRPTDNPSNLGRTEDIQGATQIEINPYQKTAEMADTFGHELTHFLLDRIAADEGQKTGTRQHGTIRALFSPDIDKESIVKGYVRETYPNLKENDQRFSIHTERILDQLKRLQEYIGKGK